MINAPRLRSSPSLLLVALLAGCTSDSQSPTNWQTPPMKKQETAQSDALSYGMVTSRVEKGVTTQEEILRMFGAPNITTTKPDGTEVWVYDRISTASDSEGWSEARRFETFFLFPVGGSGGASYGGKGGSSSRTSTRTLTVVIYFNKQDQVTDYQVRATQF